MNVWSQKHHVGIVVPSPPQHEKRPPWVDWPPCYRGMLSTTSIVDHVLFDKKVKVKNMSRTSLSKSCFFCASWPTPLALLHPMRKAAKENWKTPRYYAPSCDDIGKQSCHELLPHAFIGKLSELYTTDLSMHVGGESHHGDPGNPGPRHSLMWTVQGHLNRQGHITAAHPMQNRF